MNFKTPKPYALNLNREQAKILLKGLILLPDKEKNNVVSQALIKDVRNIITILDRRVKNERIIAESKRKNTSNQPNAKPKPKVKEK